MPISELISELFDERSKWDKSKCMASLMISWARHLCHTLPNTLSSKFRSRELIPETDNQKGLLLSPSLHLSYKTLSISSQIIFWFNLDSVIVTGEAVLRRRVRGLHVAYGVLKIPKKDEENHLFRFLVSQSQQKPCLFVDVSADHWFQFFPLFSGSHCSYTELWSWLSGKEPVSSATQDPMLGLMLWCHYWNSW